MQEKRMVVFVEASVLEDPALARDPRFQGVRDRLQTFRDGTDELQVRTFSVWNISWYLRIVRLLQFFTMFLIR